MVRCDEHALSVTCDQSAPDWTRDGRWLTQSVALTCRCPVHSATRRSEALRPHTSNPHHRNNDTVFAMLSYTSIGRRAPRCRVRLPPHRDHDPLPLLPPLPLPLLPPPPQPPRPPSQQQFQRHRRTAPQLLLLPSLPHPPVLQPSPPPPPSRCRQPTRPTPHRAASHAHRAWTIARRERRSSRRASLKVRTYDRPRERSARRIRLADHCAGAQSLRSQRHSSIPIVLCFLSLCCQATILSILSFTVRCPCRRC